jgi:hypothetical protein
MSAIARNEEFAITGTFFDGQITPLWEVTQALREPQEPLEVVLLYEDALTEEWAWEQSRHMTRLSLERRTRCCGWKVNELNEPDIFEKAAKAALEADLLVLCAQANKDLPLAFYAWADSWLPYRSGRAGTLALVLGRAQKPTSRSPRLREHLQAVARLAGMSFVVTERGTPPLIPEKAFVQNFMTGRQVLRGNKSAMTN